MKISKSQFNALAKKARKIVCNQTFETGRGVVFTEGRIMTYKESHAVLMQCAPWSVEQVDPTTLIATGTKCQFTVTLAEDNELKDRTGQLITDQHGAEICSNAEIVNIVQVLHSTLYGHYVDGATRTVKLVSGKRWQLI